MTWQRSFARLSGTATGLSVDYQMERLRFRAQRPLGSQVREGRCPVTTGKLPSLRLVWSAGILRADEAPVLACTGIAGQYDLPLFAPALWPRFSESYADDHLTRSREQPLPLGRVIVLLLSMRSAA